MFQRLLFHKHLQEDEKIIYVGRGHMLRFQKMIFSPLFFLIIVPLIAYFAFQIPEIYLAPFLAIGAMVIIYRFFDWYADGWVLTNQGILDVKWDGFFRNQCMRLNYEDVNCVTYQTNGVIPSIFGYGDVSMIIFNGDENILHETSKPARLQKKILDIKNQLALDTGKTEFNTFRSAMHKMMSDFFDQKNQKEVKIEDGPVDTSV